MAACVGVVILLKALSLPPSYTYVPVEILDLCLLDQTMVKLSVLFYLFGESFWNKL
jgi:hypothetical protein